MACHFDGPLNDPPGTLSILGLPDRFEQGQVYLLTVVLTRPDLAVAGFQLSARFRDGPMSGKQAGSFLDARGRVAVSELNGIEYVHHTLESVAVRDTARWQVRWTAPASGASIELHVAANASNDDASALGDRVYTAVARMMAQKE